MTATLERERTVFQAGKKRYVCVNRQAILANVTEKRNFPTVIVVEDDVHYEFHECTTDGVLQFDATRSDLPAKVFIETEKEIVAFKDLTEPVFVPTPRQSLVKRLLSYFNYSVRKVPLVGCAYEVATGQPHTNGNPPKVKVEPKPLQAPKPRPQPRYHGCS